LGVSYDAVGDYDRAVDYYRAALKIDEKLDYVLNNLGYSYLLQGKFDLAIENFKRALDLNRGTICTATTWVWLMRSAGSMPMLSPSSNKLGLRPKLTTTSLSCTISRDFIGRRRRTLNRRLLSRRLTRRSQRPESGREPAGIVANSEKGPASPSLSGIRAREGAEEKQ